MSSAAHLFSQPDSTLLEAALRYAARGWPVFPLAPGTKKPLKGSKGVKDATKNMDQIRWWWTKNPDANIGCATGAASGCTVLDVDTKQGKDGETSLGALVAEHGPLPNTLTQTTWSGGTHYVFSYAPGISNSTSQVGKHLDIRGDGGYIVLPPSRVTEAGRSGQYQWSFRSGRTASGLTPRSAASGKLTCPHGQRTSAPNAVLSSAGPQQRSEVLGADMNGWVRIPRNLRESEQRREGPRGTDAA